ncbi:unnamed protein product [Ixodes persulcatus]
MRQMSGGNDCLDARAVTFNLEKILRTGILCASQSSNVGPSQSVSRLYHVAPASPSLESSKPDAPDRITGPAPSIRFVSLCFPQFCQPKPAALISVFLGFHVSRRLVSSITNASIAYIAGFVVKAVEERRICSFCPILHETSTPVTNIVGLISLQTRGGLTFPRPELVEVLITVKKALDIAVPQIGKHRVLKELTALILPHLEKCPLLACPARNDHATQTSKIIIEKFVRPFLVNIGMTVTDRVAYRKKLCSKPLHRKVLRV